MARKGKSTEDIIAALREAEVRTIRRRVLFVLDIRLIAVANLLHSNRIGSIHNSIGRSRVISVHHGIAGPQADSG